MCQNDSANQKFASVFNITSNFQSQKVVKQRLKQAKKCQEYINDIQQEINYFWQPPIVPSAIVKSEDKVKFKYSIVALKLQKKNQTKLSQSKVVKRRSTRSSVKSNKSRSGSIILQNRRSVNAAKFKKDSRINTNNKIRVKQSEINNENINTYCDIENRLRQQILQYKQPQIPKKIDFRRVSSKVFNKQNNEISTYIPSLVEVQYKIRDEKGRNGSSKQIKRYSSQYSQYEAKPKIKSQQSNKLNLPKSNKLKINTPSKYETYEQNGIAKMAGYSRFWNNKSKQPTKVKESPII